MKFPDPLLIVALPTFCVTHIALLRQPVTLQSLSKNVSVFTHIVETTRKFDRDMLIIASLPDIPENGGSDGTCTAFKRHFIVHFTRTDINEPQLSH